MQVCILQSWCLVALGLVLGVLFLFGMKNSSSSNQHLPFVGAFSSAEELRDVVLCLYIYIYIYIYIPWGGTRTLSWGCTIVSWLLLPSLCMPSLSWLATVWTCPLELREGQEAECPTDKKWGIQKDFCPGAPRALLGFTYSGGSKGESVLGISPYAWWLWNQQGRHHQETVAQPWGRVLVPPQGIHITISQLLCTTKTSTK